ncbi:hypothetical protein XPA_007990 [Xanthoria parietina]
MRGGLSDPSCIRTGVESKDFIADHRRPINRSKSGGFVLRLVSLRCGPSVWLEDQSQFINNDFSPPSPSMAWRAKVKPISLASHQWPRRDNGSRAVNMNTNDPPRELTQDPHGHPQRCQAN